MPAVSWRHELTAFQDLTSKERSCGSIALFGEGSQFLYEVFILGIGVSFYVYRPHFSCQGLIFCVFVRGDFFCLICLICFTRVSIFVQGTHFSHQGLILEDDLILDCSYDFCYMVLCFGLLFSFFISGSSFYMRVSFLVWEFCFMLGSHMFYNINNFCAMDSFFITGSHFEMMVSCFVRGLHFSNDSLTHWGWSHFWYGSLIFHIRVSFLGKSLIFG